AVLLLDEPSGGVAQKETEALGPMLRRVQEQTGCSMLVIEHDMPLLSGLCDRLVAFELGEVIAEGPPSYVLEHPQVVASYLGTDEVAVNRSGAKDRPASGSPAVPAPAGKARATRSPARANASANGSGPRAKTNRSAKPASNGTRKAASNGSAEAASTGSAKAASNGSSATGAEGSAQPARRRTKAGV
ncbi:MAG: hypothetical protein ACRDTP_02370, partial [Mycobacteriales bacterium]